MATRSGSAQQIASGSGRASVLGAVTRPITLFALTLLVMEAAFLAAAARLQPELMVWLMVIDVAGLILLVIIFAVLILKAPVVLLGTEWLREPLAESLAVAIVDGLDGSVRNLPKQEDQVRAWVDLVSMIGRQRTQEGLVERQFRQFLTRDIVDRAIRRNRDLKQSIETELASGHG